VVKKSRSGFTLIEAAISIAVLGVVSTTVVEVIQWSAAQHRQAERKRCALEAATTILDEFTLRDWSTVTQKNAAKMRLSVETIQALGDPQMSLLVKEETEEGAKESGGRKGLRGKCVSVEISWANRASPKNDRVHLATWVFAREGEMGAKP
jgi:prepilin-type N-terminal cleavage/methylation domain-containing protein